MPTKNKQRRKTVEQSDKEQIVQNNATANKQSRKIVLKSKICTTGLNNNVQPEATSKEQNKLGLLASDVLVTAEIENDDFHTDEEEGHIPEKAVLTESDEEELDYDSGDLENGIDETIYPIPGTNDMEDSTVEVDSVVNFRRPVYNPPQPESVKPDEIEAYVKQLVDSKWEQKERELLRKHRLTDSPKEKSQNRDRVRNGNGNQSTPTGNKMTTNDVGRVKSPSDTTIYAPALNKQQTREQVPHNQNPLRNPNTDLQISMFLDQVRERADDQPTNTPQWPRMQGRPSREDDARDQRDHAAETGRDVAARQILEAEHFKADVTQPRGNDFWSLNNSHTLPGQFKGLNVGEGQQISQNVIDDDEFLHVSCHVDKVLTEHVERGEYVDFDKLLMKEKYRRGRDEDRLEFVNHEGHTYLAPVQNNAKINGVRK